ncbi:MAG: hypothetical protein C0508_22510 [Cyanobacteria bacterium PR.023]|nr:hypothetical protein [Cyanobacteria bacterium PR.023]
MLVVAVVATVVTGGAAAAALGGAASTFLGGAAVAAAGAVAGSVAGQLTAMATGLQSEFSWSALGKSALTGALTGGLLNGLGINSSLNEALKSGASYGQVAAYSIAQNLVGQGIAHAVGVQKGFSWASVVASAVGGMFDMRFGGSGSVTEPGKLGGFSNSSIDGGFSWSAVGSNTLRSLGRNVVTTTTQIAINGHGKLDLLSVTADAFGNALGNSIVGAMQVNKAEKKVQELEAALKELDILKEDAKAVRDALVDPSKRSLLLSKGFDPDKMRATYVANLVSGDVYLDYSSAENGNADKVARMQEAMGYFDVRRLSDDELSKLNLDPKKFVHDKSGYYAALYKDDVTGSYLLANRGTESLRDVVTDMVNNFGGVDAQFERAVSLANTVGAHKEVGENLTFTGHSLGGALASAQAAAYETGVAITFNAAGLPRRVAEKLDLDFSDQSRSRIQANYLQGDAVSIAQDSMLVDGLAALLGTPVKYGIAAVGFLSSQTSFSNLNITVGYAPEAFGARHMILPANNSWGPLTRHSNSSVLRSLTYNYLLAASAQGSN